MSFNGSAGGSQSSRMAYEFGRTQVVRPKGQHQATIVWLHGLGDKGSSWSQLLENLPLSNIKWICPTAPTRPVSLFGGFPCTAWFDAQDISEDAPDDIQGLDASAAHVANLLLTEPADIKIGVGGFSMGAATALYSATCHVFRQYGNRNPYLINLSSIIGLSGWLPCSRTLRNQMEASDETIRRAASLPILLCHGTGTYIFMCSRESSCRFHLIVAVYNMSACIWTKVTTETSGHRSTMQCGSAENKIHNDSYVKIHLFLGYFCISGDDVVAYRHGEKSASTLNSAGFQNLMFRTYEGLGHYTIPEEMNEVCRWLTITLGLQGS